MSFYTFLFVTVLYYTQYAIANNCFEFAVGPQGSCNVGPGSTAKFQAYIVLDQSNDNCSFDGAVDMHIRYPDSTGEMHNLSALNNPQQINDGNTGMIPFNFGIAYSSMGAHVLSMIVQATASSLTRTYSTSVSYTNAHLPTVTSVRGTVTVTHANHATASERYLLQDWLVLF